MIDRGWLGAGAIALGITGFLMTFGPWGQRRWCAIVGFVGFVTSLLLLAFWLFGIYDVLMVQRTVLPRDKPGPFPSWSNITNTTSIVTGATSIIPHCEPEWTLVMRANGQPACAWVVRDPAR